MKIIERFDKYMDFKGLNDNRVTVQLGLSVGILGKSRKEDRDLSRKIIYRILDFYTDLNPNWLLLGEGEMIIEENSTSAESTNEQNNPQMKNECYSCKQKDELIEELRNRIKDKDQMIELILKNSVTINKSAI